MKDTTLNHRGNLQLELVSLGNEKKIIVVFLACVGRVAKKFGRFELVYSM